MKSFLQETAEDIVSRFKGELSETEIIFPNKRTDFHFKKFLAKALNKTSWSPKTYTIQSYISQLTGLKTIDKISLLFELYHSFKEVDKEFKYDFDSFHKLGEIILHDFNEIDNYLVDAKQIFVNIKDLHEIDYKYGGLNEEQIKIIRQYWINFSPEKKSKEKEQFLVLWNVLPDVYNVFNNRLIEKHHGYEGLIYRYLANQISENKLEVSDKHKIFIGFNALNQAQKKLFKYLKTKQKALFYWDNDSYYHHNPIQEAGDFLRKNYDVLNEDDKSVPGNFKAIDKSIRLIGIPGKIGQAKAVPEILKSLCTSSGILPEPEKTVVVLPDENMLFPVLNAIPGFIPKLNITMGYPLKNTPLYSLLMGIIKAQAALYQNEDSNGKIYFKDVQFIINHSQIRARCEEVSKKLDQEIKHKQMVYVSSKFLLSENVALFEEIFTPVKTGNAADSIVKLMNILFLLFTVKPSGNEKDNSIENEYIYHTYTELKRLHEIMQHQSGNIELSFNIILQFIRQLLNGISIPFESESTDGLQIMGLIETRNIDFENVILINANEGILPKLNRPPSLISESMRHAFDLPVLKYQDSIFAYFFYRLMQRAKNIHILYDNLGSSNRSGELSRFVYQLELESGFHVERLQLVQNVKLIANQSIKIRKNKQVMDKLQNYVFENGESQRKLTASSIDTYLNCPFQFYLKYIAGIKETEQVEEEFSPVEMGNIIHSTMEFIYNECITEKGSRIIEREDFKSIRKSIESQLKKAFRIHLGIENVEEFEYSGNLLIIKEVIVKYLLNILRYDEQRAPFEILQMEDNEAFQTTIQISSGDKIHHIGIRGIIDRIDIVGNELILIDYKTGRADKEFASIDELFTENSTNRKKAILQVLMYGILIKAKPELANYRLTPYIYDIRNMYKRSFDPCIKLKSEREKIPVKDLLFSNLSLDFKDILSSKIEEIFNPEIDFYQTEFEDNCTYCPYKAICGKD